MTDSETTAPDAVVADAEGSTASEDPYETLKEDPELAALIDEHGRLAIDPADDLFRRFVVSILRQQVSMASAAAIRERLFEAVEVTPEGVLAADPETLRDAGLSTQKTEYVRNVARAFRDEGYDADHFATMDDAAVVEELTEIRGVGEWTAEMFLIFCLGREDVLPLGDLGIRKGMRALYGEDLDRPAMRAVAEDWRPYRSYASLYVWEAQDG